MSNKIYEDGFYNEYQKNRFLDNYPEETARVYGRIFTRSKESEELLGKDLYDFNIMEIEQLLNHLNPLRSSTSQGNMFVVQAYIRWAIEEDLRSNNINPLDGLTGKDYYEKFVDATKKLFFTEDELRTIIGDCKNYQDSVILQLIFEGVWGSGYAELLNLKESDIDFENNTLKLENEKGQKRVLTNLSDLCIKLTRGALDEKIYHKKNGYPDPMSRGRGFSDLVKNKYVLKTSNTNNQDDSGKAEKHLIFRRLSSMSEIHGIPYLNGANIRNSGMLKMAKNLYKEFGRLEREEYTLMEEKFNISKGKIIKEIINIDNILKYYPPS